MKDQYFGDKTDYIKHGVLRQLAAGGFNLGLHWMWTADDASSDGKRISYLERADAYRHFDTRLFDLLADRVKRGDRRLRILEELDTIPGAQHCFDVWEGDALARPRIIDAFLKRLQPRSLVFLDPDNGLSVASVRIGGKNADKYVFPDEVTRVWHAGHSIMLYQHFPRVRRDAYVANQLERLAQATTGGVYCALMTSHVAFLVCLHPEHVPLFQKLSERVEKTWTPHVKIVWPVATSSSASTPP